MKKLLLSCLALASCTGPVYDPTDARVIYAACVDDTINQYRKGDGYKNQNVTTEIAKQAKETCTPILEYIEPPKKEKK